MTLLETLPRYVWQIEKESQTLTTVIWFNVSVPVLSEHTPGGGGRGRG